MSGDRGFGQRSKWDLCSWKTSGNEIPSSRTHSVHVNFWKVSERTFYFYLQAYFYNKVLKSCTHFFLTLSAEILFCSLATVSSRSIQLLSYKPLKLVGFFESTLNEVCTKDWLNKSYFYLNKGTAMQLLLEPISKILSLKIWFVRPDEKYSPTAMNMERFLFPMQQCERKQIICHSC